MAADPTPSPEESFELVFVCTANRARSAIAEHLVRQLGSGMPLRVSSAGILDARSLPALPHAVAVARGLGLDLSAHRSRCVGHIDLSGADLVIGFERQHVASAVVDGGAAYERAFLLPELVELLRGVGDGENHDSAAARARAAVSGAHRLRAFPHAAAGAEIADPVGGDAAVFRETAAEINDLAAELVERLFPPRR